MFSEPKPLPDAEGHRRIREAACWAHLRRAFHDVWKSTGSPIAFEALERIGVLGRKAHPCENVR